MLRGLTKGILVVRDPEVDRVCTRLHKRVISVYPCGIKIPVFIKVPHIGDNGPIRILAPGCIKMDGQRGRAGCGCGRECGRRRFRGSQDVSFNYISRPPDDSSEDRSPRTSPRNPTDRRLRYQRHCPLDAAESRTRTSTARRPPPRLNAEIVEALGAHDVSTDH